MSQLAIQCFCHHFSKRVLNNKGTGEKIIISVSSVLQKYFSAPAQVTHASSVTIAKCRYVPMQASIFMYHRCSFIDFHSKVLAVFSLFTLHVKLHRHSASCQSIQTYPAAGQHVGSMAGAQFSLSVPFLFHTGMFETYCNYQLQSKNYIC